MTSGLVPKATKKAESMAAAAVLLTNGRRMRNMIDTDLTGVNIVSDRVCPCLTPHQ